MSNSVTESVVSTIQTTTSNMIPIFIGQSQSYLESVPQFTDILYSHIALPNNQNKNIDTSSVNLNIKYWKQLYSGTYTISSPPNTQIIFSIALPLELDLTCMFVVFDSDNNILFSSTINTINSNLTTLNYILIDIPLTLSGSLILGIIKTVTENLDYTLDVDSQGLVVIYDNKISSTSFSYVCIQNSTISYNINNIGFSAKIYSAINSLNSNAMLLEDISNESNNDIKQGLIASQNSGCIVINYDSTCNSQNIINYLEANHNGYYLIPINLDINTINALSSYIKNNSNQFLSMLISTSESGTINNIGINNLTTYFNQCS